VEASVKLDDDKLFYIASRPPDFISSFSGSALPFHNKEQAMFNTPNKGFIRLDKVNNDGMIILKIPNSYYMSLGNVLAKPHVVLTYYVNSVKHEQFVKLANGIPYRSLTHPNNRNSPSFYNVPEERLLIRSQEHVLIDSGYP
jgi:hypothetical protein